MRFHSAPVLRLADAKQMQLGHSTHADGAGASTHSQMPTAARLGRLAAFLAGSPDSPIRRFTPIGAEVDIDSVIDLRAVFQQGHLGARGGGSYPPILAAAQGLLSGAWVDYEKVYCPDLRRGPDVFDLRGAHCSSLK